jgi:hypothetical protein
VGPASSSTGWHRMWFIFIAAGLFACCPAGTCCLQVLWGRTSRGLLGWGGGWGGWRQFPGLPQEGNVHGELIGAVLVYFKGLRVSCCVTG